MTRKPRPSLMLPLLTGAVFAVPFFWAAESGAFPELLSELSTQYGYTGDCSLCHATAIGGGSAGKPFAVTLKGKGLNGTIGTLNTAIMALTPDDDSDGDTVPDFDELTMGGNPNDPAVGLGGLVPKEPVEYGCVGGTIAGTSHSSPSSAGFASSLVVAALLLSRRRRNA